MHIRRIPLPALLLSWTFFGGLGTTYATPGESVMGRAYELPVLPGLQLSGDTSGKATVKLSLDYIRGVSTNWDLILDVGASLATSDGQGTLFSKSDSSLSVGTWGISTSMTFLHPRFPSSPDVETNVEAKKQAIQRCLQQASTRLYSAESDERVAAQLATMQKKLDDVLAAVSRADKKKAAPAASSWGAEATPLSSAPQLIELRKEVKKYQDLVANPALANPFEFCEDGKKLFDELKHSAMKAAANAKEKAILWPEHLVSIGLRGGGATYDYIQPKANDMSMPTAYEKLHTTVGKFDAVFSYTGILQRGSEAAPLFITIEPLLLWSYGLPELTKTGKVCTSPGALDGNSIQSCKDYSLGPLKQSHSVKAMLAAGYLEHQGRWKGAGQIGIAYAAADQSVAFQIKAPFLINVSGAINGYAGKYQGLIGITPAFSIDTNTPEHEYSVTLTVSLLGRRLLINKALDWL